MSRKPYDSPAREAAATETRRRIVAAAVAALHDPDEAGPASLEAVAKRAGVTRLTVYNHFGNRRALLEAAFDAMADAMGLARRLASVGADLIGTRSDRPGRRLLRFLGPRGWRPSASQCGPRLRR